MHFLVSAGVRVQFGDFSPMGCVTVMYIFTGLFFVGGVITRLGDNADICPDVLVSQILGRI